MQRREALGVPPKKENNKISLKVRPSFIKFVERG